MALKLLLLPIAGPCILVGKLAEFLRWEVFSDGDWKKKKRKGGCGLVRQWQDQATEVERQFRAYRWKAERESQAEEARHRKEKASWERERSYLRSRPRKR